jgi:ribosomal protein L20
MKAMAYAFAGRKQTKREYRSLWITRINAAARINKISYSQLMHGLKLADININRKMLADLAISDAAGFTKLVDTAKTKLN